MGKAQKPRTAKNHSPKSNSTTADSQAGTRSSKLRAFTAVAAACALTAIAVAVLHGSSFSSGEGGEQLDTLESHILVGKADARPHEAAIRDLAKFDSEPPSRSRKVTVSLEGLPKNAVVVLEDKVVHSPLMLPRGHYTVTLDITAAGYNKIKAAFVPNRSKTIDLSDHTASAMLFREKKDKGPQPPPSSSAHSQTGPDESQTEKTARGENPPTEAPAEPAENW